MKPPKKNLTLLLFFSIFTSSCQGELTVNEPTIVDAPTIVDEKPTDLSNRSNRSNLSELSELSEVLNESTGAHLFIKIYKSDSGNKNLPVLVLVPGGNGDSQDFVKNRKSVESLADKGFIIVTFDPDGRGKSEGMEDYNGFKQQDGLKAVIEAVAAGGAKEIGLVTFSYGITMGSGVLARYPEIPVEFLIDWEGPANRNDTGGCDGAGYGHLTEVTTCWDETFWAEREASTFMKEIKVPYLRIQSEKDHVQPDSQHAWLLTDAALNGKSAWVRVNEGEVNTIYDSWEDLPLLGEQEEKKIMTWIGDQAHDLFNLD